MEHPEPSTADAGDMLRHWLVKRAALQPMVAERVYAKLVEEEIFTVQDLHLLHSRADMEVFLQRLNLKMITIEKMKLAVERFDMISPPQICQTGSNSPESVTDFLFAKPTEKPVRSRRSLSLTQLMPNDVDGQIDGDMPTRYQPHEFEPLHLRWHPIRIVMTTIVTFQSEVVASASAIMGWICTALLACTYGLYIWLSRWIPCMSLLSRLLLQLRCKYTIHTCSTYVPFSPPSPVSTPGARCERLWSRSSSTCALID